MEELSNDYEKLFESELGYDVIIYAEEERRAKSKRNSSRFECGRRGSFIFCT